MIEPMTASLAVYLLTHPPRQVRTVRRTRAWLRRHSPALLEALRDEVAEPTIDALNLLPAHWSGLALYAALWVVVFCL